MVTQKLSEVIRMLLAITYFTIHKFQTKMRSSWTIKSQNVVCMPIDIFLKSRLMVANCLCIWRRRKPKTRILSLCSLLCIYLYMYICSNINEVIRTVLDFFFYDKISQAQKSINPLTANKNKKIRIKNI